MTKPSSSILTVIAVIVFFVLIIGAFLIGNRMAFNGLSFKNVTANQAAEAMKNDDFYSNYKENILIIRGQVSSYSKSGTTTTIGLKTDSSYSLSCTLNDASVFDKVGDVITIEGIGGTAVRDPSGVSFPDCKIS